MNKRIKQIHLHTTKDSKPFSWKWALVILILLVIAILWGLFVKSVRNADAMGTLVVPTAAIVPGMGVIQGPEATPTPKSIARVTVVEIKATPTPKPTSVEEIIESVFGDKKDEAIKVAFCESSLNPKVEHKTSSAKGLFQIMRGTWKQFKCTGDPLDALDNTVCAKKIYDYYGSWNTRGGWAASYLCHYEN
jgi:hypothetical protein